MGFIKRVPIATVKGMARPPEYSGAVYQSMRERFLVDTVDYLSERGLADVSLRPLAAALGTSSRMLIYYFGTKDELLAQALHACRPDFSMTFAGMAPTASALRTTLSMLWQSLTSGRDTAGARILLQAIGIACAPSPFAEYAREAVGNLVDTLTDAFTRIGHDTDAAATEATILGNGLLGLLYDRFVTGDVERVDRAAAALIARSTAEGARIRE
jgi:AcrR family transcriptional regulator